VEALDIILKAWHSERFKHEGKFWSFPEITLYPRPVQQPHPPIWVAGTSARTLEWAGRMGYDIMTVGHPHPPDKVRLGVEAWKKALTERGIDPQQRRCQFHTRTHVSENSQRARGRHARDNSLRRDLQNRPQIGKTRNGKIRLGWHAGERPRSLRQSRRVHRDYPQRDSPLLFQYLNHNLQFWRHPA